MGLNFKPYSLFIKIDFEKAYDRIEWVLSLSMLEALGFGFQFLHIVHMLFQDAFIVLSLSNSFIEAISLHRSLY